MLIYDQAFDPYHSAVRILAIAKSSSSKALELAIDAARIADYFLVYPTKLTGFRFPAEFRTIRSAVEQTANPYRHAVGTRAVFERMRPIFFSAVSGLVAAGYIDAEALRRGILKLTEQELPMELIAAIQRFQDRQTKVGNFVLSELLSIHVNGDGGLKHRSGLIEHRYDIA